MLTVLRDELGQLQVACEWWCVDDQGHIDWQHGRHAYVGRIEMNPLLKMRDVMRQLSTVLCEEIPRLCQGYWERDDTGDRLHWIRKDQLIRKEVLLDAIE